MRYQPPPPWARLVLLAIALSLIGVGLTALQPSRATGVWGTENGYSGTLHGNATQSYELDVVVPGGQALPGLRFVAQRAEVALRPTGPVNGTPFRVAIVDAQGNVLQDRALDPANPFDAPHGPPIADLPAGRYSLVVASLDGNDTRYSFLADVVLPFAATKEGVVVPAWLPPALGVVALVAAAAPGPALAARLGRRPPDEHEPPPPQPPASP